MLLQYPGVGASPTTLSGSPRAPSSARGCWDCEMWFFVLVYVRRFLGLRVSVVLVFPKTEGV